MLPDCQDETWVNGIFAIHCTQCFKDARRELQCWCPATALYFGFLCIVCMKVSFSRKHKTAMNSKKLLIPTLFVFFFIWLPILLICFYLRFLMDWLETVSMLFPVLFLLQRQGWETPHQPKSTRWWTALTSMVRWRVGVWWWLSGPMINQLFVGCSTGDGLLDYSEFVDAALVGSKTKRRGKGGPRGSPRARSTN